MSGEALSKYANAASRNDAAPLLEALFDVVQTCAATESEPEDQEASYTNRSEEMMGVFHQGSSNLRKLAARCRALRPDEALTPALRNEMCMLFSRCGKFSEHVPAPDTLRRAQFNLDFSSQEAPALSHLRPLGEAGFGLYLQALMDIDQRNFSQALESIELALALAEVVANEPTLLSLFAAAQILEQEKLVLERLLCRHKLEPADMQRMNAAFSRHDFKRFLQRALIGSRCEKFVLLDATFADGVPLNMITRLNQHWVLDRFDECIKIAAPDWPVALRKIYQYKWPRKIWYGRIDFSIVAPTPYEVRARFVTAASAEANQRLVLAAVLVETARSKQDTLPRNLDDLSPALKHKWPRDPFDGKPVRYRRSARGYNVYSVSANLADDGGARGSKSQGDLVFQVSR